MLSVGVIIGIGTGNQRPKNLCFVLSLFLLFLGGNSVPTTCLVLHADSWLVEEQETGKEGPSFRGTWYS